MITRQFASLLLTFIWLVPNKPGLASCSASVLNAQTPQVSAQRFWVRSVTILSPPTGARGDANSAVNRTQALLQGVRTASYPDLTRVDIRVRTFQSNSDYFRTRFDISRYLSLRRMRFYVEVNPLVFDRGAPEQGVRAIIAHELEHVLYFSKRPRIRMLSIAGLASSDFTARFERRADLRAIGRGYGSGLILYRQWLYGNITDSALKEKRRDYFSPEEIAAIQLIIQKRPEALRGWLRHVPLNIEDIKKQSPVTRR
jgi:hypothetical protein